MYLRGEDGSRESTVKRVAAVFYRMMMSVGSAVPQTVDGDKLFRVQDEGFADHHPKARGPSSRRRLSFHSDRCDVICFLCIRQAAQGGSNQLVSAMAIYNRILSERPDLLEQLCEPCYYRRHNVDSGNQHEFYQQPVFSDYEGHFACSYLRVLIDRAYSTATVGPMPTRLREALDYLDSIAEDPEMHVSFRQQPGDIVLMNNYVTLHRRSEFVDSPQAEEKRLLMRLWLAVPNSRPLADSFAAGYGDTTAGAIRGGMRTARS